MAQWSRGRLVVGGRQYIEWNALGSMVKGWHGVVRGGLSRGAVRHANGSCNGMGVSSQLEKVCRKEVRGWVALHCITQRRGDEGKGQIQGKMGFRGMDEET